MEFCCGDSRSVRFLLDIWIGDISLPTSYSMLFSSAKEKEESMFSQYSIVDGVRDWNIQFELLIYL